MISTHVAAGTRYYYTVVLSTPASASYDDCAVCLVSSFGMWDRWVINDPTTLTDLAKVPRSLAGQ